MDAVRTLLVFVIVGANLGHALAQNGWSNAGPTTPATISASPTSDSRYSYPAPPERSVLTTPQSIPQRTQTAVTESATAIRDGFNAGVRAAADNGQAANQQFQEWAGSASRQVQSASSSVQSTAQQAFGAPTSTAKSSNPWVTTSTPAVTSPPRGGTAPPPWPNSSATPAPISGAAAAPGWTDPPTSPGATSSSAFSAAPATPTSSGWTTIGTAAPPLLTPQQQATSGTTITTAGPSQTAAARSGPDFPADPNARSQTIHSPLVNSTQPATTNRSPADDWSFNNSAGNSAPPAATIGRYESPPSNTSTNSFREANSMSAQPVSPPPDQKSSTTGKSSDWWADSNWSQQPPARAVTVTANSGPPTGSSPSNVPATSPPAITSAASNFNPAGPSPITTQTANNPTITRSTLPVAPSQPWLPLIASVLSLAGSLAANMYLGWSYLDSRQKYQSLVRRTADTFRRSKTVAA